MKPTKKATAQVPLSFQKDGIEYLSTEFDSDSDGWFLYAHKSLQSVAEFELWHMTREDALDQAKTDWGVQENDWASIDDENSTNVTTRDSNGVELKDGDAVTLIKDLPVKGAGVTIKRGTTIKNISLTNNPEEIDCRSKEVKDLVLKSCFVKKL